MMYVYVVDRNIGVCMLDIVLSMSILDIGPRVQSVCACMFYACICMYVLYLT